MDDKDNKDEIEYAIHVRDRKASAKRHMKIVHDMINKSSNKRLDPETFNPKKPE